MTSKSIILNQPYIIVTFSCVFIIGILMKDVAGYDYNDRVNQHQDILNDLPQKTDIGKYVKKLDQIVQFANKYNLYVDMNFGIGLFLVNINLRLIFSKKSGVLPDIIKTTLYNTLKTNDEVMKYFERMFQIFVKQTNSNEPVRLITQLFISVSRRKVSSWTNHLQKYTTNLMQDTKVLTEREMILKFSHWRVYLEKVYNLDDHFPSAGFLDNCIASLALIPVNHKMTLDKCNIFPSCVEVVYNGTDFGYRMIHRLLFMVLARFSRGCALAPQSKNYTNIDQFCALIYNEAEYLSLNNFRIPDLSMEQISLCSLLGHAQFVRRSWINNLLQFQTSIGCFGSDVLDKSVTLPLNVYQMERPKWDILHEDQDIVEGACNSHTTGMAAAMLSAAIRYILEKF